MQRFPATRSILPALALVLLALPPAAAAEVRQATFAGGCFWCMEPPFDKLDGVTATVSGYANGHVPDPTYEQVVEGDTGHYEAVQVHYDPARVSYQDLLEVYWANIDPVDNDGQFCDRGDSYRAAIFPHDPEQASLARTAKQRVAERFDLDGPLVTPVEALTAFYPAEAYHQDFYRKSPGRYRFYRWGCGRDSRLEALWGERERLDLFPGP